MLEFAQLNEIRRRRPLLHCVSNVVSVNDCANIALAAGASPIMAPAAEEAEEITARSQATVLNTGTPDPARFLTCEACFRAVEKYPQPVVLDPVGVGASSWRLRQVAALLDRFRPSVLRVNLGEAQALCGEIGREQGVDSVNFASVEERSDLSCRLAKLRRTTVLLTGREDLVSDGKQIVHISGGSDLSSRVTGCGDMLSVLCGAFAAVEHDALSAAVLASAFWKGCAAYAERAAENRGIGSFRIALFSAAEAITAEELEKNSRIEVL